MREIHFEDTELSSSDVPNEVKGLLMKVIKRKGEKYGTSGDRPKFKLKQRRYPNSAIYSFTNFIYRNDEPGWWHSEKLFEEGVNIRFIDKIVSIVYGKERFSYLMEKINPEESAYLVVESSTDEDSYNGIETYIILEL